MAGAAPLGATDAGQFAWPTQDTTTHFGTAGAPHFTEIPSPTNLAMPDEVMMEPPSGAMPDPDDVLRFLQPDFPDDGPRVKRERLSP